MTPDLQRVRRPEYLADVSGRTVDEIRAMRAECQALENGLSYVRRLAQGRLDILAGELEQRRHDGKAADLRSLIERLPEILSDRTRSEGGAAAARPPQDLDVASPTTTELEARLDAIAGPGADPAALDDEQLGEVVARLVEFEQEVSAARRHLHEVFDVLSHELTRRYRSGEATVDSLLG